MGARKLLKPDPSKSLFKLKIYYSNGGESTYFSFDYKDERDEFEARGEEHYKTLFATHGGDVFRQYNGFFKQMEHLQKLAQQGRLKKAFIYLNQVYAQYESGFMPMVIRQIDTDQ